MNNVNLKNVEKSDIRKLISYIKNDFPSHERVPKVILERAFKKNLIFAKFLTSDTEILGYILYNNLENESFTHVIYFAILSDYRSKNYGSEFMKQFRDEMLKNGKEIILEVEDPAQSKNDEEVAIRTKRIAFYERLNFYLIENEKGFVLGRSCLFMSDASIKPKHHGSMFLESYVNIFQTSLIKLIIKAKKF